jgi:hypothetical protein
LANVKITQLAADTNPASTDVLPFVDVSSDETKKVTIADLLENAGDGSAGAPAFAFDNDADTGMYSAGANALGFTTGGTGRLFINSNGHAGIGTSSPDRLVHIFKGEAGTAISDSNTALMIENSTHAIIQMASPNNFSNRILFGDPQDADAGKLLYDHSNNSLQFYVNASERVRIDSSGNVGIGTASPSSDLDVFNTGFVNLKVRSSGTNTAALNLTNSTRNYSINSSGGAFTIFDATASSERLRLDSSGRLLIGTSTSPTGGDAQAQAAPLLVQGRIGLDTDSGRINLQRGSAAVLNSSIGSISFTDVSNNAYARISVEADADTGTDDYPGRIKFQTTANGESSPTTALTINRNGMLGINELNPGHYIDMNIGSNDIGMKMTSTDAGSYIQFKDNGTSGETKIGAEGNNFVFDVNGSERVKLDSSGRLLVGTSTALTTPTDSRVQVSGNDFATSSIRQTRYQTGEAGASLILSHARGTEGSPTILANGDELGKIRWNAYDGTDFMPVSAEIKSQIDGTIQENQSPGRLVFSTTASGASLATERMRITSDGTVRLSNSPGIDFSGIQTNASGMSSEILDSYEEGTFTPVLLFGSNTTGITYNARAGFYVKVGKVVHAWVYINLSSKGTATGAAAISQFPFTSEDINVSGLGNWPGAQPSRRQNETSSNFALTMVDNSINCACTNGAGVSVTDATFTNGTILEFALCYRAA